MRTRILIALAAAALAMAASRSARACGSANGGGYGYGNGLSSTDFLMIAIPYLAAGDLAFTIGDGVRAFGSRSPEKLYGVLELVVAAPQLGLGIWALGRSLGTDRSYAVPLAAYTAWMVFLTSHAIWTMSGPSDEAPPKVLLGPTYAPVGQQARPGFGLSGRF